MKDMQLSKKQEYAMGYGVGVNASKTGGSGEDDGRGTQGRLQCKADDGVREREFWKRY